MTSRPTPVYFSLRDIPALYRQLLSEYIHQRRQDELDSGRKARAWWAWRMRRLVRRDRRALSLRGFPEGDSDAGA